MEMKCCSDQTRVILRTLLHTVGGGGGGGLRHCLKIHFCSEYFGCFEAFKSLIIKWLGLFLVCPDASVFLMWKEYTCMHAHTHTHASTKKYVFKRLKIHTGNDYVDVACWLALLPLTLVSWFCLCAASAKYVAEYRWKGRQVQWNVRHYDHARSVDTNSKRLNTWQRMFNDSSIGRFRRGC